MTTATDIKEIVKSHYGEAARSVKNGRAASCAPAPAAASSCCSPAPVPAQTSCCSSTTTYDPITSDLYEAGQTAGLPEEAILASLGCGNPTALAQLNAGEVVLDLGSGGGIDVLLSARRVGPAGKAYGLDMTDDMLDLARENQRKAGVENVEFLKGEIEHIPLPDNSVDVIISNCVINLSADKGRVLREAFRVLKPGGRFAVSDVVRAKDIAPEIASSMELWAGCVAGALHERDYRQLLGEAGFTNISVEPTRVYAAADARQFLQGVEAFSGQIDAIAAQADGAFMSAFVRATKP